MKRIVSLILAPVLVLTLCCPLAFASPVPVLPCEVEAAESTDGDAPQYAVYTKAHTINMQNNTYADLVFTMADKGGATYFEDLVSISFRTTNPNGSHWEILEYSYTISPNEFWLYTTVRDMEGNTPSVDFGYYADFHLTPSNVIGYSLSAQDGNGTVLIPASESGRKVAGYKDESGIPVLVPASVGVCMVTGYKDESGIPVLAPASVRVFYLGEEDAFGF